MNRRGFTLVELLIALAIFSVLSLASWQVLHQVINAKSRLTERSGEFRQLQKAVWLVSQDLRSIVDRPIRDNQGTREPAVSSVVPGYSLVFTRNGFTNPLGEKRSELQRVGYGIRDNGDVRQLIRFVWPVLDRAPSTEPRQQVLMDGIDRLDLQFIDSRGQAVFYWPPSDRDRELDQIPSVPSGIRLRFSLPDWGELERTIHLRDVKPS